MPSTDDRGETVLQLGSNIFSLWSSSHDYKEEWGYLRDTHLARVWRRERQGLQTRSRWEEVQKEASQEHMQFTQQRVEEEIIWHSVVTETMETDKGTQHEIKRGSKGISSRTAAR